VCIAIPPVAATPLPVGVPKNMIESMVTAAAMNIRDVLKGTKPSHKVTSNSLCLADFGDEGVAFAAMPQIPPRNVNWASKGKWIHYAKVGLEKYFIHKVRHRRSETFYEKQILKWIGADKLKEEV
jgi:sulfide:quinone oxidoreductase